MKVVACIIARTNSHRLPAKVLSKLWNNHSMIEFLVNRLKMVKQINSIYICTSDQKDDDILEQISVLNKIKYYRGSPDNVLERMLAVGEKEDADILIRITGDNPLTAYEYIDIQINLMIKHSLDYIRLINVPIGATAEVIRKDALLRCNKIIDPLISEYLMLYLFDPDNFECGVINVTNDDYSQYSITIDTPKDLIRAKEIILESKRQEKIGILLSEILEIMSKRSEDNKNQISDKIKEIKMPYGERIKFEDFLKDMKRREMKSHYFNLSE